MKITKNWAVGHTN